MNALVIRVADLSAEQQDALAQDMFAYGRGPEVAEQRRATTPTPYEVYLSSLWASNGGPEWSITRWSRDDPS